MYYFRYSEELSTNKKDRPYISFGYKVNDSNMKIHDTINYFDNLSSSAKEELDMIYNYSLKLGKDKIDKDSYFTFIVTHNISIPPISKRITRHNVRLSNEANIIMRYAENKKDKELVFWDKELALPKNKNAYINLLEAQVKKNNGGSFDLTIHKEGTYENDIELLYMLLDCLFSSNISYYIKKCELCNKYYATNKPNKRYCYRMTFVYGKQTICENAVNLLYQSKQYKIATRKDEKLLKYLHNYPNKYDIDNYNYEKNIIKKECIKKLNMTDFENYVDNFLHSNK